MSISQHIVKKKTCLKSDDTFWGCNSQLPIIPMDGKELNTVKEANLFIKKKKKF